jgi:hypothetical protein
MCRRFGLGLYPLYLDYRYWQCRKCGFNPHDGAVWMWWVGLHWTTCDMLERLSTFRLLRGR